MDSLTINEFNSFHGEFDEDVYACLTVESSVNVRNVTGGTSEEAIKKRIREIESAQKRNFDSC